MQPELTLEKSSQKISKNISGQYVHYGCGLSAPTEWINFDVSPSLRIQRTPVIGSLLKNKLNVTFPENVKYGDIIKGLPGINENSCDGVYCSHVLEHLSLDDFRLALTNTYNILKPGGIFRCVVPDLEVAARDYIRNLEDGDSLASIKFIGNYMLMGTEHRPKTIKGVINAAFSNAHHLWMWDSQSMALELKKTGFRNVRKCTYNDSKDAMFELVESEERFENAVAYECTK